MTTFNGLDYYASDELYRNWENRIEYERQQESRLFLELKDGRPPYEWDEAEDRPDDEYDYDFDYYENRETFGLYGS